MMQTFFEAMVEIFSEAIIVFVIGLGIALVAKIFSSKKSSDNDWISRHIYEVGLFGLLILGIIVGMCSSG